MILSDQITMMNGIMMHGRLWPLSLHSCNFQIIVIDLLKLFFINGTTQLICGWIVRDCIEVGVFVAVLETLLLALKLLGQSNVYNITMIICM